MLKAKIRGILWLLATSHIFNRDIISRIHLQYDGYHILQQYSDYTS